MTAVEIFIPGKPTGKARPRFGKGKVFTDAKTKAREQEIGYLAKTTMAGQKPFTGAVRVHINMWMHNRTGKPDIDNAAKIILDAFNGIVWTDDKNVVSLAVDKHACKSNPQTVVTVEAA